MRQPDANQRKKKLGKPAIAIIIGVIVIFIAIIGGSGGDEPDKSSDIGTTAANQTITSGEQWDANSDLFGMTVEHAWDEIEQNGYALRGILSITGAELNNDESVRHSSSAQTWRITNAEVDESDKSVVITITSHDDFVDKHGSDKLIDG